MSLSARRLSAGVETNRFAWQVAREGAESGAPAARVSHSSSVSVSALRELPSPSAERVQAIEREAFAKGYAQGERAGDAAAAERIDVLMRRLAATVDEVAGLRVGVMHRAEREMVRLALAMAERILRREIAIDRDLLVAMARVAVDRLGDHAVATIHLHPADCEAAGTHRQSAQGAIEIVSDPTVPPGGCLVRSAFGTIDAGIESQIRELSRALLGEEDDSDSESAGGGPTGA